MLRPLLIPRDPFTLNLVPSLNISLSTITTSCNTLVTQPRAYRNRREQESFLGNSERGKGGGRVSTAVAITRWIPERLIPARFHRSRSLGEITIGPHDASQRRERIPTGCITIRPGENGSSIVYETCAGGLSVHEIALLILAVAIKISIAGTANNSRC